MRKGLPEVAVLFSFIFNVQFIDGLLTENIYKLHIFACLFCEIISVKGW